MLKLFYSNPTQRRRDRRGDAEKIFRTPLTLSRQPFRVFFAGRIEINKGVYDIVEIARRLSADRSGAFRFDICGIGSELNNLRQRIDTLNLEEVVHCHALPTVLTGAIVAEAFAPAKH